MCYPPKHRGTADLCSADSTELVKMVGSCTALVAIHQSNFPILEEGRGRCDNKVEVDGKFFRLTRMCVALGERYLRAL